MQRRNSNHRRLTLHYQPGASSKQVEVVGQKFQKKKNRIARQMKLVLETELVECSEGGTITRRKDLRLSGRISEPVVIGEEMLELE